MIGIKAIAVWPWVVLLCTQALAQGFGKEAGQSPLPGDILKFSLYGKEYVYIGYGAKTATGGAVGAGVLRMLGTSQVRGDLYVSDSLVAGITDISELYKGLGATGAGPITLSSHAYVDSNMVATDNLTLGKDLYVKGSLRFVNEARSGGNLYAGALAMGTNAKLLGQTTVKDSRIAITSLWGENKFGPAQVSIASSAGDILASREDAHIQLSKAFSYPEGKAPIRYEVPTTTVTPDTTQNCSVTQDRLWRASDCTKPLTTRKVKILDTLYSKDSLEADVLPPGRYGHLKLSFQAGIVLEEGIYEFQSIDMNSNDTRILVDQPNKGRTQVLVRDSLVAGYRSVIKPMDTKIKGGTVLLYQGGERTFDIGQGNTIYATVLTPNALAFMGYETKLFGQIIAKKFQLAQGFEADDGLYIPFSPANPAITVSKEGGVQDEGHSGSAPYPFVFDLNYMNGRDITIFFHTENGTADANDFTGSGPDSVVIPAGSLSASYSGVQVLGDRESEPDETFLVVIDSVRNAEEYTARTPLTIANDDGDKAEQNLSVVENTTAVSTLPPPGEKQYYIVTSGADQALFKLDSLSGSLNFLAPPDYEHPADANLDGTYELKAVLIDQSYPDYPDFQKMQYTLHIQVTDTVEQSQVVITQARTTDFSWKMPDTIYVKQTSVDVTWTQDGSDTSAISLVENGKANLVIKTWEAENADTPGSDTLVVVVNQQAPHLDFQAPPVDTSAIPAIAVREPVAPGDTVIYVRDPSLGVQVKVNYIGKDLKSHDTLLTLFPSLDEGLNTVSYTFADPYGNSTTGQAIVELDRTAPVVLIASPAKNTLTHKSVETVAWSVDGSPMDTLLLQSLALGANAIVRCYGDKAGNVGCDTVNVALQKATGVDLDMEKDLVDFSDRDIENYQASRPSHTGNSSDELFSLSVLDASKGVEYQTGYGSGKDYVELGADQAVATATLDAKGKLTLSHLGPTLVLRVVLPQMGGTDINGHLLPGSIAFLQDENGLVQVTAGAGSNRVLATVEDYVKNHCLSDAFTGLSKDSLLNAPLYRASVELSFMVYDQQGQFVDRFVATQSITEPSYLDENGLLTLYLELRPGPDGLQAESGRLYGTGVYILSGQIKSKALRLCDMPEGLKGVETKTGDKLTQRFGYRRHD